MPPTDDGLDDPFVGLEHLMVIRQWRTMSRGAQLLGTRCLHRHEPRDYGAFRHLTI
jgi:hypothetical protein